MASPSNRRRNNSRKRILDAAASEFSKSGYSGTSVRDIATLADILPGSMYYHFSSKEELLAAVQEEGLRQIKEEVTAAVEQETEPWARLEAACAAHLKALHASKEYGSVIITEFPNRFSKKVRAQMIKRRDEYEDMLRGLIDDLPLPPSASRKYLRLSLLGAMGWSVVWYKAGKDSPKDIAHSMVNLFRGAE
jgi:TetR/AcrR family transcriptional regulator, cholesterol catabolism regulator